MPQPPQVTIRDPSLPVVQVRADTPPRVRSGPSRRQWLLASALLLVLVIATSAVTSSVSSARHRATERRLDAAAAASVSLALTEPTGSFMLSEGQILVALRNDSGRNLRIVRARVDDVGYAWQNVDVPLSPAAQGNVVLVSTPVCRAELADSGPPRLLLDVMTDRGTKVATQVPLYDGEFGSPVTQSARAQCAIRPPAQSLETSFTIQRRSSATSLLLSGSFINNSVLPLSVTGIRGVRGLTVSTPDHLPLVLAPLPDPHTAFAGVGQPLRVLLTVDCAYIRANPAVLSSFVVVIAVVRRGDATVESPQYLDETGLAEVGAMAAHCPP